MISISVPHKNLLIKTVMFRFPKRKILSNISYYLAIDGYALLSAGHN